MIDFGYYIFIEYYEVYYCEKVLEKSVLRWNFYIMLIDNGILSGLKNSFMLNINDKC